MSGRTFSTLDLGLKMNFLSPIYQGELTATSPARQQKKQKRPLDINKNQIPGKLIFLPLPSAHCYRLDFFFALQVLLFFRQI
jgi:hypothetical protein